MARKKSKSAKTKSTAAVGLEPKVRLTADKLRNSPPHRGDQPAVSDIKSDFGPEHADTLRCDQHPNLRADYVLAN